MNRDAPGSAEDTNDFSVYPRIILSLIIALVLIQPAVHLLQHPVTASGWFQLAAAATFGPLVLWKVWVNAPGAQPTPRIILLVVLALGIALFVAGGKSGSWIPVLAFAAALCGRYSTTPVPAIIASAACAFA